MVIGVIFFEYALKEFQTEFFVHILEKHIMEATVVYPYLVERCMVAIIRAAIHLLPMTTALLEAPTDDFIPQAALEIDFDGKDKSQGAFESGIYSVFISCHLTMVE
jgi:hypothetical protein